MAESYSGPMIKLTETNYSLVGGHQSLQSCCQRGRSRYSLGELRKHLRDKKCTSKDFLDAEVDEFEAQGRPINCLASE